MNKMNKKGFTLIEMLVVIAIIAVLVAIIVPTVKSSTTKAKAAADAANLRTITAQAGIEYLENDNKLASDFTVEIKSEDGKGKQNVKIAIDASGALVAYVDAGYGVDYYAALAEDGVGNTTATVNTALATVPKKSA